MLDTLITVAVLLALAFPVLAIVAIVMASNARHDVSSLQARVVTLEAARRAAVAPAPSPAAPNATLEERFGTRWVVWIGGLALALGGVFLVRYAVEHALLGPGVRIF